MSVTQDIVLQQLRMTGPRIPVYMALAPTTQGRHGGGTVGKAGLQFQCILVSLITGGKGNLSQARDYGVGEAGRISGPSECEVGSNHISIYIPIFLPSHPFSFFPHSGFHTAFHLTCSDPFQQKALSSRSARKMATYSSSTLPTRMDLSISASFDGRIISLISDRIFALSTFVSSVIASAASVRNANDRRCFW